MLSAMKTDKTYYVYILTNRTYTVLYTGVTSGPEARLWQHKTKVTGGFTSRYNVNRLVFYEATTDVWAALEREKEIKLLTRAKKNALVESMNPCWVDLGEALFPPAPPDPSRMTTAR
jgi:putative endonuclease